MKIRVEASCFQANVKEEAVVLNGLEQAELAGRLASRKVKQTLREVPLAALRRGVNVNVSITLAGERAKA